MIKFKGEIGLTITALIWGTGFIATSIALDYVTPLQLMALRFFVGALLMSLVFIKKFKTMSKETLRYGCILGVFLFLGFMFQTIGLTYTSTSNNAFLTSVNVVIVPFIGYIVYKRKFDMHGLIGACLAMFGIWILSVQSGFSVNAGDLLTLCCALFFALHIFYTGEFLSRNADPIGLTVMQMITAFVLSLVFIIFNGSFVSMFGINSKGIFSAIYLGVFCTTVAFLLQTMCQKFTSETKAAIIMSTEAVFATIFSVIILHEIMTLRMLVGCCMIFIAILVAEIKPKLF